jgi:hypothetical protein
MKEASSESSKTRIAKEQEEEQLDLKISSKRELLYRFKRWVRKVERDFTVLPFWRNGYIWILIISILSVSIINTLLIAKKYSLLPPEVPILYITEVQKWQSFPRIFLFMVPLALFLIGVVNIRLLQRAYYMNKRLTQMICLLLAVAYILELIGVNELILLSIK